MILPWMLNVYMDGVVKEKNSRVLNCERPLTGEPEW